MKRIIILKGLPASGKSTWAKAEVTAHPNMYKRISKDDMREMLDSGVYSKSNEKFVLALRDHLIIEALKDGKHVIVDDTNLNPVHETEIRRMAKWYAAENKQEIKIEIKEFNLSLDDCIFRDSQRETPVGKNVIRSMYDKYLKYKDLVSRTPLKSIQQDESLPRAIICDLDGTLALLNNRSWTEEHLCETDDVNESIKHILEAFKNTHYILLTSGRKDTCKEETERWLKKHNIGYRSLFMRKADDNRRDSIVKYEMYEQHIKDKYYVEFVLDDRDQVVDMWRNKAGLTCLQVNYGNF